MKAVFDRPVEELVRARHSVRTYSEQVVPQKLTEQAARYIGTLSSPFSAKVSFRLLETGSAADAKRLGTYGMIRGASRYIGAAVEEGPLDMESLGYEFEQLILFLTSLGLGTCWLGGTFHKSEFAKAMGLDGDELFPAVSPFGFAAEKPRLKETLTRYFIKADERYPWERLFFSEDFSTPLFGSAAGEYAKALEMIRLAPSASNKQPWRILKSGSIMYHFYEYKAPGYSDKFAYDIQRIDMGIAACHFQLTAMEAGLQGRFQTLSAPETKPPEHTHYCFSWVCE